MSLYPVFVSVERCRVLVVGGGAVATRKVRGLVDAGGRPTIVSPHLTSELKMLVDEAGLTSHARPYDAADVRGVHLVFACTDRPDVNARILADAEAAGALANLADDGDASTFHVPAVVRRGEVVAALSTGGASPLLARRLKERLEGVVTEGVGRAARRLARVRDEIQARWPGDEGRRREAWFSLVTPGFVDDAVAGRDGDVETRIERCLSQS